MDDVVRLWEAMAPLRDGTPMAPTDLACVAARFAACSGAAMAAGASLEIARLAQRDADAAARLARALGPANARAILRVMQSNDVEPEVIIRVLRGPAAAAPPAAAPLNLDAALARGEASLVALAADAEAALYETVGQAAAGPLLAGALSCARTLLSAADHDP